METSFSFASAANMLEYNSMEYDIYFDESGDLGWKINEPYRREGSSRFFTIAYLILPKEDNKYINRFLKHFHKNRDGKRKEYKGLEFRNPRAKVQARLIKRLIDDHPLMTIGAVTAKKSMFRLELPTRPIKMSCSIIWSNWLYAKKSGH